MTGMTAGSMNFDRVAHEYDESRGGAERARAAALDIVGHLPPGDVVEIGVGTGIVAEALRGESGHRIAGADISVEMLKRAAARLPGALVRASADQLPFPGGCLDGVVAVHVLHLVADLPGTLAEAARVLRPGGRLVAIHGELQQADDELAVATKELRAMGRRRPDSAEVVLAAGTRAGFRLVAQHPATPQRARHSPASLADLIRRRSWSALWDLDDDAWQQHVVPVLDALAALPDQDRPRPQQGRAIVTALERT